MKIWNFMLLLVMAGCSDQHIPIAEQEEESQLSDKEITLAVDGWEPLMESRAALFDNKNFLESNENNTLPGGNFTLDGYLAGKGTTFLKGARGWYFADTDDPEWRFRSDVTENGNVTVTFPTYYWPNSDAVNFFAYMPYKGYQGGKEDYVTIGEYTEANGQQFSCALPETNANEANQIEFIYAYEANKTKDDQTLHLYFKHPFALVQFKLASGSYRMTVNNIKLENVYLNGTFSTATGEWENATNTNAATYTATINKRIPTEINYNTVFGGPYLMMPQDLINVSLTLNAVRSTDKELITETAIQRTVQLKDIQNSPTIWKPGNIYTYILSLGDNNEEIYFNVKVENSLIEDWKQEGKYEANVE